MTRSNYATIVAELAKVNPLTWSTEGLDDVCLFCDAYVQHGSGGPYAEHKPGCLWLSARLLTTMGEEASDEQD